MKVTNRSDGAVTYTLDEMRIRRVFTIGESKNLEESELNALYQTDGGKVMIQEYLLVEDEAWVNSHWDAPLEYFWKTPEITKCLKEDSLELFRETLEFAPEGVRDLIKTISWKMPLTDLNKISAILEILDFDVMTAIKIMSDSKPVASTGQKQRLRQRSPGVKEG